MPCYKRRYIHKGYTVKNEVYDYTFLGASGDIMPEHPLMMFEHTLWYYVLNTLQVQCSTLITFTCTLEGVAITPDRLKEEHLVSFIKHPTEYVITPEYAN